MAQSPSHSLTDPVLRREREGVLNRIAVDKIAMKNRPLGPASSIELPPPGETSVGFPWRPVPEHLVNLPGIGEPLTAGDPPLSQTGQLPRPLGRTSLRKAQWFNLCPMTNPFFKETAEVMKEIAPADKHGCQSQHVSNSNSASIKHLSLLPSPTASSQSTLPCSIHHPSFIIHHQW